MKKTTMIAFLLVASSLVAGGEVREIECKVKVVPRSRIHPKRASAKTLNNQVDSSNWSGYVAASSLQGGATDSVTYVAGDWKVPSLLPTSDASYCAIWVGIDGYFDGTVEQMGTSHNWVDGAQQNYAWFEMYPNGSYEIDGFPVNVGDEVSVRIGYKGDNLFKLVITNWTQGVSTVIPSSYTTAANVGRSSAEWVVEAPYSSGILPLSDFNVATMNYCSAIINGVKGSISDGNWVNDSIVMENSPTVIKAVPSALLKNGTAFQVTWKHE